MATIDETRVKTDEIVAGEGFHPVCVETDDLLHNILHCHVGDGVLTILVETRVEHIHQKVFFLTADLLELILVQSNRELVDQPDTAGNRPFSTESTIELQE